MIQPDGGFLVGGAFHSKSGNLDRRANNLRLLPSGAVDERFNASTNHFSVVGPNSEVQAIAAQPDGKMVIGGCFTAIRNTN
jgi:hypothetical protein